MCGGAGADVSGDPLVGGAELGSIPRRAVPPQLRHADELPRAAVSLQPLLRAEERRAGDVAQPNQDRA